MNKAQESKETAMERLTTGKRINSAADDAAGLAIANKMTSQVRGLNQAVRNSNDGISMLQTAAGGLEESKNILQRMRELSIQSASGTYQDDNRGAMQDEVEQLKAELDRISETTTFNGIKILDGSQDDTKIQAGANANETIGFSIGSTASADLGGVTEDITGDGAVNESTLLTSLKTVVGDGTVDVNINGQNVGDLSGATDMEDVLSTINENITGVTVGVATELEGTKTGDGRISADAHVTFAVKLDDMTTKTFEISDTSNMDEVVDKINEGANGALTASLNDFGRLVLNADDAVSITVTESAAPAAFDSEKAVGIASATASNTQLTLSNESGVDGPITLAYSGSGTALTAADTGLDQRGDDWQITGTAPPTTAQSLREGDLQINGVDIGEFASPATAAGAAAATRDAINEKTVETGVVASVDGSDQVVLKTVKGGPISIKYGEGSTAADVLGATGLRETNHNEGTAGSVANIDISTDKGAQEAIEVLDVALKQVSDIEGELGAVENRLSFTVSNLSNVSENASAARSRIEDTDYAAESANLSRAQVLQQAGQAMLSQANSAPQQVLSLLQ
jgi:flagellin